MKVSTSDWAIPWPCPPNMATVSPNFFPACSTALPEATQLADDDDERRERLVLADDEEGSELDPTKPLRIAVVGRPNAGKSTLINRLLGEDRLLIGPEAGITRDSISVDYLWQGKDSERQLKIFDTAGLRKRAKVEEKLEKLAAADALRAIRFAEVVVVLLDATIPFEKQDLTIVDLCRPRGQGAGDRRQQMGSDRRQGGNSRCCARRRRGCCRRCAASW